MNIQCEKCNEIVPLETFQPSVAGIQIECGACAESFFVPARAPRRVTATDGGACPKCQSPVPADLSACARCGLEVSRFENFVLEEQEEAHPELLERWQQVETGWEDSGTHDSFVEFATMTDNFPFAARRYRVAARDSARSAAAEEQLIRIRRMAEAKTFTQKQVARSIVDKTPGGKGGMVLILLSLVVVTIAAVAIMSKFSENIKESGDSPIIDVTKEPRR